MTRIAMIALALAACATTYEYDPATLGDPEGGDRAPRSKTSSQFVRGVYADLLGRTPATFDFTLKFNGATQFTLALDEQTQLAGVLDGLGDALPMRNVIVNGLLHGSEVTLPTKGSVSDPRTYIKEQFTRLLGREPNPYELAGFADAWDRDAAVGPRTIIRAIVGSREYQSQ
ncbi:MAG TPA: hypothetical protein VGD80_35190 [Kofleriaceae bacterium]